MTGTAYIKIRSTISSLLVNVASVERFFEIPGNRARKANEDDLEWNIFTREQLMYNVFFFFEKGFTIKTIDFRLGCEMV